MITKYLKMFFQFLLPILRSAAIDIASDELTRMSRKDRMRRPVGQYASYAPRRNRQFFGVETHGRPRTMQDVDRIEADRLARLRARAEQTRPQQAPERFHDVLMVAFDIVGPNEALVHEWLAANMPSTEVLHENNVYIDDAWIADDGAGDDRDSAVFVTKGNQRQARELLRQAGLVE